MGGLGFNSGMGDIFKLLRIILGNCQVASKFQLGKNCFNTNNLWWETDCHCLFKLITDLDLIHVVAPTSLFFTHIAINSGFAQLRLIV